MPPEPSCIFCRIVAGEIPAHIVLETSDALAFLDVGPLNPGHTLLIPKAHYPNLPDLSDDLAATTAALLPRLCRAVRAATGAEGLNILSNTGRVAGQSVDHIHWHVIPRHSSDAFHWPWPAGNTEPHECDRLRDAIRSAIAQD
jgi:histidine triad (HIT) family protein